MLGSKQYLMSFHKRNETVLLRDEPLANAYCRRVSTLEMWLVQTALCLSLKYTLYFEDLDPKNTM